MSERTAPLLEHHRDKVGDLFDGFSALQHNKLEHLRAEYRRGRVLALLHLIDERRKELRIKQATITARLGVNKSAYPQWVKTGKIETYNLLRLRRMAEFEGIEPPAAMEVTWGLRRAVYWTHVNVLNHRDDGGVLLRRADHEFLHHAFSVGWDRSDLAWLYHRMPQALRDAFPEYDAERFFKLVEEYGDAYLLTVWSLRDARSN